VACEAVVVVSLGESGEDLSLAAQEVLELGRAVAVATGAELRLLVLGALPGGAADTAASLGVAAVDFIEDAKLESFSADASVAALAQYCSARSPSLLLLNQSFRARLIAPRLAGRIGAGVVMNALTLEVGEGGSLSVTTSAFGGDTRTVYDLAAGFTHVVSLLDNLCEPTPSNSEAAASLQSFAADLSAVDERIRVLEPAKTEGPRLEDAQAIVAGGRGLQEADNFALVEELAAALGGVAGASRPIVDDGWTEPYRQVGLTGKITKPSLYIAAGISGASQHMVGCSAAKTLVAINTDADAAIFRYARYGVVGDCLELLPEITRAVKS